MFPPPFYPTINGMRVRTSELLTKGFYEDWSGVRSPARARRRMKKHRQNIRYIPLPDPAVYVINNEMHMHPEVWRKLQHEIEKGETK